MATLLQSVVV